MSPTWILFTSGQAVEVIVTRNIPSKVGGNPADVYMITECHRSFQESAQRAAAAFYRWAETSGRNPEPFAAGIDLAGLATGDALTGESGGIAIAVALAKVVLGFDPGPVAATGVVSARNGQIEAIKGLSAKLEGAANHLPRGGWIFFPQAHLEEEGGSAALAVQINDLRNRGFHLHAVSTLAEVLSELFCSQTACVSLACSDRKKRALPSVAWVTLAGAVLVSGFWAWSFQDHSQSADKTKLSEMNTEKANRQALQIPVVENKTVAGQIPAKASLDTNREELANPLITDKNHIRGKTRLAEHLAAQVEERLKSRPDLRFEGDTINISMTGLIEEFLSQGMVTTLNLEVSESQFLFQHQHRTIPPFKVQLSQTGAIPDAMSGLAAQLADHWLALITSNDQPNSKNAEKITDSGFQ